MGSDNSSQVKNSGSSSKSSYSVKTFHYEIDKFYTTQLTKHQFVHQLFAVIDSKPHPQSGKLTVCNTYILQRLYLYLTDNQQGANVNCAKMKNFVQAIYTNPQVAIEKSFSLIDLDGDRSITDAQFLSFMDNCFISLMVAVEKTIVDNSFRVNLKEWVMKHKKQYFDYVLGIFQKYKKSDPRNWNYNDFKRWVLSGQNWTVDIQIAQQKFRTPLNILCLFAVPLN